MGGHFDFDIKKKTIDDLELELQKEEFWSDKERANEIVAKIASLKKEVSFYEDINSRLNDLNSIIEINDDSLLKEIEDELINLASNVSALEINTLFNGEYDSLNCYLEIHPGAGGTESCDWADMLKRMYVKFCEKNNFVCDVVYEQKNEEAGLKDTILLIKGVNAYGLFRSEKGVHRLVRISPFDSNKRRHTSFASVSITPEIKNNVEVDIKESDLKIDVYHSSGAGGQSVNTADSAVRITHLPTKIVVTCQNERSQLKNKEQAMEILKSKIFQLELEKKNQELAKIKGESLSINFGSQIRNYTLEPYRLVKDTRTGFETSNTDKVLDGDIKEFMIEFLRRG